MKPLPELMSFLEGLPEPHILFDTQYRILAANAAYRRQFSPDRSVVGRTCFEVSHHFSVPCDQAGESCPLVKARESGQRERVLHLHHTAKGEEYVNIELAPLLNGDGEQAFFIEKMESLRVAQGQAAGQGLDRASRQCSSTCCRMVARVAPAMATVLLLGESGTGKELVARAVHEASSRSHRALVPVDCSSLPENLFESELFGHERGAFTGANTSRGGLVEAASGGTLFLDEVGDIPLTMQVKLLRLLETGTYRRVGSTEQRHADIRVVSATHRDLDHMVAQGRFREDLYYRLSTFPIHLPALRERRGDIALLAVALLKRVAAQRKLKSATTHCSCYRHRTIPAMCANCAICWNAQRCCATATRWKPVMSSRPCVWPASTSVQPPQRLLQHRHDQSRGEDNLTRQPSSAATVPKVTPGALKSAERAALGEMLKTHPGSRAELAAKLGISERSLYRKIKSLKLL
jgi:transcriptional regulator with PAS, ATPase and Fis domain